jgi:thiamine pyrophosphate-dependent acetolactate synthase large subunit-like protein
MQLQEALEVLARCRGDKVVITTMASVAVWPALSDSPLDFHYIPSSMGQAPALGLGLALAVPGRGVVVVNGDGSMLMNLGSLVTLAAHPAEVYLLIMQNDLYEVTGGQPLVGAGLVDYAAMARAAGIRRAYSFADLPAWSAAAEEVLRGPGPVVCALKVQGRLGQKTPAPPRPMSEQIARLRAALGIASAGVAGP